MSAKDENYSLLLESIKEELLKKEPLAWSILEYLQKKDPAAYSEISHLYDARIDSLIAILMEEHRISEEPPV